jgi:uncharacterized membrane protein
VKRLFRHLLFADWLTRRYFPPSLLRRIEAAVATSERGHSGEVRFSVEGALHPRQLWHGMEGRERAVEVFSNLRVWDTAANNGVLIYLLLADRDVEIVADRGLSNRVLPSEWEEICRSMEAHFARGEFEAGSLLGIAKVDALLRRHFPVDGANPNELPDAVSVL